MEETRGWKAGEGCRMVKIYFVWRKKDGIYVRYKCWEDKEKNMLKLLLCRIWAILNGSGMISLGI